MKKLFLIPFVALAMAGCSNDEVALNGNNGGTGVESDHFLTVNLLSTPDNGTRAGGDQQNGDPNGGALYEEGYAEENDVKNVRFYFYDSDGNIVTVKKQNNIYVNYFDWENPGVEGSDMPNVEKQLQATLIIQTKDGDGLPEQVVALINPSAEVKTTTEGLSLSELRAQIQNDYATDVNKGGIFEMMNAVYGNSDNEAIVATAITSDNYAPTEEAAKANPINIYVERTVAKVRVKFGTNVNYNADTQRIALTDGEDPIMVNGKQVYLQVGSWNLTADTDKGYLSKHINPATWNAANSKMFANWNYAPYFRSYWATNPTGAKQQWHTYNDIEKMGGKKYDGKQANSLYTNENAPYLAVTSTQTTGKDIEKFTKVIIGGVLVDEEGKEIEVTKYAGITTIGEDALRDAMLKSLKDNNNLIYLATAEGTNMKFAELSANDVEFKTAMQAGQAKPNEPNTGRYYVYLQLTEEAAKADWSKSNAPMTVSEWNSDPNDRKMTGAEVNQWLVTTIGKSQVYKGGLTYYYFPIRHLGASGNIGYYGVVRNHIYDCTISALTGLGTPVYDPDEVIYPEKPTEDDTYIAAKINILSWRVVSHNYPLEW